MSDQGEKIDNCVICLEPMPMKKEITLSAKDKLTSLIVKFNCKHSFHRQCAKQLRSSKCPNCRTVIIKNEYISQKQISLMESRSLIDQLERNRVLGEQIQREQIQREQIQREQALGEQVLREQALRERIQGDYLLPEQELQTLTRAQYHALLILEGSLRSLNFIYTYREPDIPRDVRSLDQIITLEESNGRLTNINLQRIRNDRTNPRDSEEIRAYSKEELRIFLRLLRLRISGNKATLVVRLKTHFGL